VLHKSVTVSPWVAAVESMVEGHHGTVSKDSNVEKGELATKEKKTRAGTLQPAARVRVGLWVEISNPHLPRRQPARQTCGFAQPVINPSVYTACLALGPGLVPMGGAPQRKDSAGQATYALLAARGACLYIYRVPTLAVQVCKVNLWW
jgi:hypothetical protein